MLKELVFKFGAGKAQPRLRCRPGVVTVFVGPNNAGKSRALVEMAELIGIRSGERSSFFQPPAPFEGVILRRLKLALPSDSALRSTFIKAVCKDLGDPGMRGKGTQEAPRQQADELRAVGVVLGGLVVMGMASELVQKGKINPRKLGIQPEDLASGNTDAMKAALGEVVEAAKAGQTRALARRWIAKRVVNLTAYAGLLVPHTIVLDGTTRLSLVNPTQAPDWRQQDGNFLVNLLKDRERLETLRRIVRSALGYFPVIDSTYKGVTQLKLSKEHPEGRERSSEVEALRYFEQAWPMTAFSDGVRSFVGLLAAVLSGDFKVILIDEPEAFLHPPLARTLGAELHKLARDQNAQVFAATHSPDFLMGCMQTGTEVNIIRLTYKEGVATARELKPEQLKRIMRNPLMRSSGVLGALFHAGAVVCESDSDRAFYQEINERLLATGRGAQGVAFLNAQNKQTIERIVGPLREMGIPAAAIVDLDLLSKGEDLNRLLWAAGVSESHRNNLNVSKNSFLQRIAKLAGDPEKAKEELKKRGLEVLPEGEREEFISTLIRPLRELGIFVVTTGELESWLPQQAQGIGRSDKPKWLMKVFERLGDDPEAPAYVHPGQDDVWAFMDAVASWIANPRQGIPAVT